MSCERSQTVRTDSADTLRAKENEMSPPDHVTIFWCRACGHVALNPGKNPAPICADPACGCRCKFRRVRYTRVDPGAQPVVGKA